MGRSKHTVQADDFTHVGGSEGGGVCGWVSLDGGDGVVAGGGLVEDGAC